LALGEFPVLQPYLEWSGELPEEGVCVVSDLKD